MVECYFCFGLYLVNFYLFMQPDFVLIVGICLIFSSGKLEIKAPTARITQVKSPQLTPYATLGIDCTCYKNT